MTSYQINLKDDPMKDLLCEENGLKTLLEGVVNQILEAQMTEYIGAEAYERSEERKEYRNGYRTREISTRVGPLLLRIPQTRHGHFRTDILFPTLVGMNRLRQNAEHRCKAIPHACGDEPLQIE